MNPYGVNHTPLKRARLPVPPLSLGNIDIILKGRALVKGFLKSFLKFSFLLQSTRTSGGGALASGLDIAGPGCHSKLNVALFVRKRRAVTRRTGAPGGKQLGKARPYRRAAGRYRHGRTCAVSLL